MKYSFFPIAILAVTLTACDWPAESIAATQTASASAEKPVVTTADKIDKAAAATKEAAMAVKEDVVKATGHLIEQVKHDERVEQVTQKAASMIDDAKVMAADVIVATGLVDDSMVAHTARASAAIKQFARTLQAELKTAMAAGGAVNAIDVCHRQAAGIATEVSAQTGYNLERVALKNRHPQQAASAWNKTVLEAFEARLANGEAVDKLVFKTTVTNQDGSREFRMMKAIPTGKVCLTCHGDNIQDEIAVKLDELYPHDQARGFKEGDIRGAFVVTKTL